MDVQLQTTGINSDSSRGGEGDPPSVIHAPPGFAEFVRPARLMLEVT